MTYIHRFVLVVAAFVATLTLSSTISAREPTQLTAVEESGLTAADGKPYSIQQVRQGIYNAARISDWEVLNDDSANQLLTLKMAYKKNIRLAVDVKYTATSYKVTYRDSAGLSYVGDASAATIHPRYYDFLEALKASVRKELGAPKAASAASAASQN